MNDLHYIQKGDRTVNGQYRFVSHDQVTAKVQPLLVKHGITAIPTMHEMSQDGNRTLITLLVTFSNADKPEDCFTVKFYAYGVDGGGTSKDGRAIPVGDKGPGKAISYAYKYALLKVFNLETGEDPDNDAEAAYEPEKCLEFDHRVHDCINANKKESMQKFLEHTSASLGKHVEDVKRKALMHWDEFLKAFERWSP